MYERGASQGPSTIMQKHNTPLSETQHVSGLRAGGLDAELLHLPVEVRALDAEVPRGVAEVAPFRGEAVEEVLPLETRAGLAQREGAFVGSVDGGHLQQGHHLL